jgi:hypothetical protein
MNNRPGCISGLLELFFIERIFGWFQRRFGFGRGGVCGCGCGVFLFIVLVGLVCSILTGTNWSHIGF